MLSSYRNAPEDGPSLGLGIKQTMRRLFVWGHLKFAFYRRYIPLKFENIRLKAQLKRHAFLLRLGKHSPQLAIFLFKLSDLFGKG